ncbi:MFS general substrate transporter [Byssothecium circinans]|uniref:MFS general substrate transporter n=1 Tax=Byssothecium circinans TaxID=147558 RepID=A0A6A5TPH9_9PLEO|nr:MFS general substrate transporter [Byssothecium circinans]KAF1950837.1 MFS general substrate transporter [Byssothecium circinans]
MAASTRLHGLFDVQSSTPVASPPVAYQKKPTRIRDPPSIIELDDLTFGNRYSRPSTSVPQTPNEQRSGFITPKTPHEVESSSPPTPTQNEGVAIMQSWNNPPINKWRILCCCMIYFGNGLNDSVVGALIPYMEVYYHIGYAIVSMIFVGNAAGFITAAFFTNSTLDKLGRAKTMIASEVLLITAYIMIVVTPPYPVVVIAFFLLGYGFATNLALNNVFCANLQPSSAILGAAHGSYGVGGIVAPIIGTVMVSSGILWSRFFIITLALRFFCIAFVVCTFWSYKEDEPATLLSALERTASRQAAAEDRESKLKNLRQALVNRVTIFGALFIFAYQGAEVSVSGWVISFLINYRGGDPAHVGYVTAGFWGGITLGRFVLTHAAPKVGEKNFVIILTIGSALLQLLAWLIPNVIGNAVAVSVLGLLLGPVYPCAQTIFTRLMPRHVQTTAIGFIAGAGSSGGAVAPFTTGLLAQAAGTWVLHPVCIGLYVVMMACWVGLPRVRKRTE